MMIYRDIIRLKSIYVIHSFIILDSMQWSLVRVGREKS